MKNFWNNADAMFIAAIVFLGTVIVVCVTVYNVVLVLHKG